MTLWEVARFELRYQSVRPTTWLYFTVLLAVTFVLTGEISAEYARMDGSFVNGPFIIAAMMLLGSTIGLVIGAAVAGDAAARGAQTRMDPLLFTTPVTRMAHLGGRFVAAFGLYALLLSAVPLGLLLVAAAATRQSEIVGPFRLAAYLDPYVFLLLPNAFVATAAMFSLAAVGRRAMASYLGAVLLLGVCALSLGYVARASGQWEVAKLLDPFGATVLDELARVWTPVDRRTRLIAFEGWLLWNRVLWIGIAFGVLAVTYRRFRFAHHEEKTVKRRSPSADPAHPSHDPNGTLAPVIRRTFGVTTRLRQVGAIARDSFGAIAGGWGTVVLAAAAAFLAFSGMPLAHMGVPLVATTERIIAFLAAPLTRLDEINGIVVPLLISYYAGELTWRDREARMSEIADASPVPDWTLFAGRFAALGLLLAALQALMIAAGVVIQISMGHRDLQIGLYARTLFGLQLVDWLLFGLLALVVQTLVNQKYTGHLATVVAYLFMVSAGALGVEHNLLVYGSDPGWMYSDMRGLAPFVGPWLSFKIYWVAWGLFLAVVATLFHVRGKETGLHSRLELARRRLTRPAVGLALTAAGLVVVTGSFIFYNTNLLNAYETAADAVASRADYERRYGRLKDVPQPSLTAVRLEADIHPKLGTAKIHGTFTLVNSTADAIDTVHLATRPAVRTTAIRFDRPARVGISDDGSGHRTYVLEAPLRPGASLRLDFEVHVEQRGFPNRGIDASVTSNATYFTNGAWLPAIGYQPDRELRDASTRRAQGLAARPEIAPLDDDRARQDAGRASRLMVETIVGTDEGQVALGPGRLRRTWTEGGRRYYHYATDAPIRNDYALFSAAYEVREGRWQDVAIQIFHHPGHRLNLDRMLRSVQASLDYYTRQFGRYPHGQIRLVERAGASVLLHASPVNIWYEEPFSLLNPDRDARMIDLPFAVVAHEVAHQWWGNTLIPADVEGAALLTESLAWYSALGVVEETLGSDHLERLLNVMRGIYLVPRTRANVPLLRASDQFLGYRKGPFALYALREYVGSDRVNGALRRLLESAAAKVTPLPTSLDLYRELQAVTPGELRPLLGDLFETNTFWELSTRHAAAEPTQSGHWQVTLDLHARKVRVDTAGIETEVPVDDLVEVGVFGGTPDAGSGKPLYLQRHRLRSGEQRVTVSVPDRPVRAGIDPRHLLIDVDGADNVRDIGRR